MWCKMVELTYYRGGNAKIIVWKRLRYIECIHISFLIFSREFNSHIVLGLVNEYVNSCYILLQFI